MPDETGGPYPGDGSNGPNVLDDSGIVRSDITQQLRLLDDQGAGRPADRSTSPSPTRATATPPCPAPPSTCGTATGTASTRSTPRASRTRTTCAACRRPTRSGTATFTSIFPAAYSGRWPHIHFEVYQSLDQATSSGQIVKTSQIALPEAACAEVYATSGYEASVANLAQTSLTSDNVFGNDGGIYQLATVTGNATDGYVANLTIGV